MKLYLLPLMGPFHLRYPAYNSVTVRDLVKSLEPDVLAITALEKNALSKPSWQDNSEIALPLSVIPWAKRKGLALELVFEKSPDPGAEADFRRFAKEYPQLGQKLHDAEALLKPFNQLLAETLSLERIYDQLIPLVRDYQMVREELLEDGPATDWLHARVTAMAERILALDKERVVVLASLEHIPFLEMALSGKAQLLKVAEIQASEESRERSILDFAFRTDVPEPGSIIAKLRTLSCPEARYHEANLLLANGHLAEALSSLEKASKQDFQEPYFLPGFLLARLGQVYDLAGNRKAALRAYKGVLALSYAPSETLEAARQGLEKAFGET